jgi:hypothetical protein
MYYSPAYQGIFGNGNDRRYITLQRRFSQTINAKPASVNYRCIAQIAQATAPAPISPSGRALQRKVNWLQAPSVCLTLRNSFIYGIPDNGGWLVRSSNLMIRASLMEYAKWIISRRSAFFFGWQREMRISLRKHGELKNE